MKKLTTLTVLVLALSLTAPAVQADPRPDGKGDDVCAPYCQLIDGWIAFATSLAGRTGAGDGRDQRPSKDVPGDRPGRRSDDWAIHSGQSSEESGDPRCLGCPGLPHPKDGAS